MTSDENHEWATFPQKTQKQVIHFLCSYSFYARKAIEIN